MDWIYKIDWLYWIDFILFGAVGFVITIWTLINTKKVKEQVTRSFERIKYFEELMSNIQELQEFKQYFPFEPIDKNVLSSLKTKLIQISSRYDSFISSELKELLADTNMHLHLAITKDTQSDNERLYIDENLTIIIESLRKETYKNV